MSLFRLLPALQLFYAQFASAQTSSTSISASTPTALSNNLLPAALLEPTISPNATQISSAPQSITTIVGVSRRTVSISSNATSTSSFSPQPTNSQPCNGHVEFCNRRFSNVSMVVAHNSPFAVAHNAASNQALPVLTQLNDGIRGLQFETHILNGTVQLCHTNCNLLNAGSLEAYLELVSGWLADNPYEVIAIMMGNDARVSPTTYIQPFTAAGMLPYLYHPSVPTANLTQWPTLSEMILANKRVVVMLDYLANQDAVPWLLDEFSYQWQTPFSPTDPSFPCTEQRPPNQPDDVSRDKMYMVNHNLNIEISDLIPGVGPMLIPAYTLLDAVNAVSGNGSLGVNVEQCTSMWGRPPNWLLVDYYNYGNFNGSVFQVAAMANNVTYSQDSCCGTVLSNRAHGKFSQVPVKALFAVFSFLVFLFS
ncbi:hypothetical protein BU24DRAFT_416208 [Aaosphaeria arxii CBS 175.79]|uniref:PLC-like phosphodiesterase n=1 Tax=Aaosphaeria arxii CBS 175.79 TaxID=1450172 RepID=A0A6A5Y4Q2_9PLEO|nr:uncharacterized protein BU24DRAFT_416208 [Aaosphaeria arxii CBS 175.79]KAF2020532.1 hypothetical protein BU24DRAFT_416208 [Aaosphaeria arxii CBS 175.79]